MAQVCRVDIDVGGNDNFFRDRIPPCADEIEQHRAFDVDAGREVFVGQIGQVFVGGGNVNRDDALHGIGGGVSVDCSHEGREIGEVIVAYRGVTTGSVVSDGEKAVDVEKCIGRALRGVIRDLTGGIVVGHRVS